MIKIFLRHKIKEVVLFKPDTVRQACIAVAAKYMSLQRENIAQGVTPDGRQFRPYSPLYRENKARAGRDVAHSWLVATGKMLRSERVHATAGNKAVAVHCTFDGTRPSNVFRLQRKRKKRVKGAPLTIGMSKKRQVANTDLATWNNRIRPFVGVTKQTVGVLLETFVDHMRRAGNA